MTVTKPGYYDRFQCLAGSCPDSCCHQWEVQVDDTAAEFYRGLPGPLGDRLREVLRDEDGAAYMTLEADRCPMWREDGLCRIQAELGHGALCKTCREFPRLTHDYGDFVELGLELSCPEAARWILGEAMPTVTLETPEDREGEYDREAMTVLLDTRAEALALLDSGRPVGETLALLLLWGCEAQARLDGDEGCPFTADAALATAREMAAAGSAEDIRDFFLELDILTGRWQTRLQTLAGDGLHPGVIPLARYLIQRHWLQAVSDYDLYCRVKFILVNCLLVSHLGGSFPETAQLFSKEIENSWENLERLLDAAYSHRAFTDDKLLGLVLRG